MSADSFLDSNLFIYHVEKLDMEKYERANDIIRGGIASGDACISFQVVQEVLNTVIRKAEIRFNPDDASEYLRIILEPLFTVSPTAPLYHRALEVQSRYRFAFYDSLIVAAALEAGCRRLLTEDLQHGQRIDALTIENPFV